MGVRGTKALPDLSLVPFLSWGCAECPSWLCSSPPKLGDPSAVPGWGPQVLRLRVPRGSPPALVSEDVPDLSLRAPFSSSSCSRPCLSQPDPALIPLSLGWGGKRDPAQCPLSCPLGNPAPGTRCPLGPGIPSCCLGPRHSKRGFAGCAGHGRGFYRRFGVALLGYGFGLLGVGFPHPPLRDFKKGRY